MQNNHASAIKGLNIAVIVLAAGTLLACLAGFAMLGIGGYAVNEYGHHAVDSAIHADHELERELAEAGITDMSDITSADVIGLTNFAFGLGTVALGWELVGGVITLVAGILGVAGASKREKLGGVFVWGIVGAVVALLGGRLITCALLVVSAIFANMDKRAYAIPYGQPPRQG